MKPGMQWPIGIVAILASSVVANVVFMRVANNDPSFAVEPDYYNRAVAFDTTLHAVNASNALGWSSAATIDGVRDGRGTLHVAFRDRAGAPLVVDSAKAVAFFNGRANDVTRVALSAEPSRGAGFYAATLPVVHGGQWEIQIDAHRGADHFVSSARIEVTLAAPSRAEPSPRDSAGRPRP